MEGDDPLDEDLFMRTLGPPKLFTCGLCVFVCVWLCIEGDAVVGKVGGWYEDVWC